jgi:hypothetical protein
MPFDESLLIDLPEKKAVNLIAAQQLPAMVGQIEPDYERLADAIYKSEGGKKTSSPYGVQSVKVSGEEEARRVSINTARNNYQRWLKADKKWEGKPVTYIEFLSNRHTPPSTAPEGNRNWKYNVPTFYAQTEPNKMALRDTVNAPIPAYSVYRLPPYIRP